MTPFNADWHLFEVTKSAVCLSLTDIPAVCSSWQSTPQTAHLWSPWFCPASAGPTTKLITAAVRHDVRQKKIKSCDCMTTEIRLAKQFHLEISIAVIVPCDEEISEMLKRTI